MKFKYYMHDTKTDVVEQFQDESFTQEQFECLFSDVYQNEIEITFDLNKDKTIAKPIQIKLGDGTIFIPKN